MSRNPRPNPGRPTPPPLTEAEQEALTDDIRNLWRTAQRVDFLIGQKMRVLLERGHFDPGSFREFCADHFEFSDRHAYRCANAHVIEQATQTTLHEAPLTEGAARELGGIKDDRGALRDVQAELRRRGTSLKHATASQVREAVKAAGYGDRKPDPGLRYGRSSRNGSNGE